MTEADYIMVSNLARIRAALVVMAQITPGLLPGDGVSLYRQARLCLATLAEWHSDAVTTLLDEAPEAETREGLA